MDLEQQIAKLKELQTDLEQYEATQSRIRNYEQQLRDTQRLASNNSSLKDPHKTDSAKQQETKYLSSKKNAKKTFTRIYAIISVIIIIILATFWLAKYNFFFFTNHYRYTPEIIKTYSGTYVYNQFRNEIWDHSLTFTSCDQNGNIEGIYEYSCEGEILGKYEFEGTISKKSPNNSVYVSIQRGDSIVKGTKTPPFEKWMYLYITDNYSIIHSTDGNTSHSSPTGLFFCDQTSAENQLVANMETPEIIGSYEGYFHHGGSYYSRMQIDSCDAVGNITGVFEADLGNPDITDKEKGNDYTKYNISGKILQKYTSGRVIVEINQGEILEQAKQAKTIPTMTVEFFDHFNMVTCSDYQIEWINNDQYSKRAPLSESEQTSKTLLGLCIFLGLPILLLIVAIYINYRIGLLSKQEREYIATLEKQDTANEQANNQWRSQQLLQKQTQARKNAEYFLEKIAECNRTLQVIKARIAKNDILPDNNKNLDTVYNVIKKLESKQDPLKAALYEYQEERGRLALENFNRKMDALEAKRQREKEADARESHRLKVETAQREQAEHLKKIREMLEK